MEPDPEQTRIRATLETEWPGHAALFEDVEGEPGLLSIMIRNAEGMIVTRGNPRLLRSEVRKWSPSELRAILRLFVQG